MPKPSALSALFKLISCGTLLLFAAAPPAAGQSSGTQKNQTENVLPQFHFSTGGPSGLRAEQRGRGTGIFPSFWKGADLLGAPQPQIRFPRKQQTQPFVRASVLPPKPSFARFAPPTYVPALNTSNPFSIPAVQTADAIIPPMPNALPRPIARQQNLCSVPLLRIPHDPSENFSIAQVPAPRMDLAMVVKPLVPSCDEKTSLH
jgi:hypothetical protein